MNSLTIPKEEVLDTSIALSRQIVQAIDVLRPLVYQVYQEKLWEGRFSSFGEYVESPDGLNRSQGYASKLRTTEQWRLDSGLAPEAIQGIDYEALYLSIKSGGTPEEVLAKAKTLSRTELKQTRLEAEPHDFIENTDCKKCGLSRENHQ